MTPHERALEEAARALKIPATALPDGHDPYDYLARLAVTAYLAEAGDGWRPIETAPKDGDTHILVWPGLMGRPLMAIWEPASRTPPMMRIVSDENHDHPGYWRTAMTQKSTPYEPTHWRPLPAPPAAQEKK